MVLPLSAIDIKGTINCNVFVLLECYYKITEKLGDLRFQLRNRWELCSYGLSLSV